MWVPARFHSAPADFSRRGLPIACVQKSALISPFTKERKLCRKHVAILARFHRLRKQKINRRAKNRALQAEIAARKAEKAAKPAA